jgi:nucleoside-diphosphate-sugar epimerase
LDESVARATWAVATSAASRGVDEDIEGREMTTLVTGATGRIGSRFVPRLLDQGDAVRVFVRDPGKAAQFAARGADVVTGDLLDEGELRGALDGVSAVVHLAAAFRGVDEREATAVNRDATTRLARAALDASVGRFVYASTNLVYGHGRRRPAREEDEPAPAGVYPETKAASEALLRRVQAEEGLGLRILRFAFVYGEGDPHLGESLLWARGWPLHKRLHLVHHADVAQALLRALRTEGIDGETFNIADDAPVTAYELLELNGQAAEDDAAGRPLDDPWEGIVDTAKSRRVLGFRPIHPTVYAAREAGAL